MLNTRLICSSVGSGVLSKRFLARTTMPGVQKPHCNPPQAMKLSANVSRSSSEKPSSVRTLLPAAFSAGIAQETTARSSTITVQHPHCPVGLHPSLGEMSPQLSRSTSSSETPSSISTARLLPFKVNSIVLVIVHSPSSCAIASCKCCFGILPLPSSIKR